MEKKFVETLFRCGKCGNYIKAIRQYNGMKIIDDGCLEFRIFLRKNKTQTLEKTDKIRYNKGVIKCLVKSR